MLDLGSFSVFQCIYSEHGSLDRDQPVAKPYLHTEQHKQNKHTQTSIPRVGFEPTAPVYELENTVHTLGHAVTVIGKIYLLPTNIILDKHMGIW
jgi:hypothetical protein